MQYVKVSDDRMTFLRDNAVSKITNNTDTSIELNKTDGILEIEHPDSVMEMDIARVFEAICMGFDLETAKQLMDDTLMRFEVIDIKTHTRNEKEFRRQKARIIGENGKAKRVVSDLTEASIQVNGNEVGIIGETSDSIKAREAIMKIIRGSPHSSVYNELEKYKRKKNRMMKRDYSL